MNDNVFTTTAFKNRCQHNEYIFDESLNVIECSMCNKELNPIWIIEQLVNAESRLSQRLKYLEEETDVSKSTLRYRGVSARVRVNFETGILFGKINNVTDTIYFEGVDFTTVKANFEKAVEGYLQLCAFRRREQS